MKILSSITKAEMLPDLFYHRAITRKNDSSNTWTYKKADRNFVPGTLSQIFTNPLPFFSYFYTSLAGKSERRKDILPPTRLTGTHQKKI